MAVKPIPEGQPTVTPYLIVQNAPRLIEFLKTAFGAQELHRLNGPDGQIMHAQMQIGDSPIMLGEAMEGCMPAMPATVHLYVTDCDATYQRALRAGATSTHEPNDAFWGDRFSGVKDPTGNHWFIATHQEDVSPEEMSKRFEAMCEAEATAGTSAK